MLFESIDRKNKQTIMNRNLIPFNNLKVPRMVKDLYNDFDYTVTDFLSRINGNVGRTNVIETDTQYQVEILMPGAVKEKINLEVHDGVLNISYKEEKTSENYVHQEWSYSEFNRSFSMPENAETDKIEASYDNGVLKLLINKKQQSVKLSNRIEIK